MTLLNNFFFGRGEIIRSLNWQDNSTVSFISNLITEIQTDFSKNDDVFLGIDLLKNCC